MSWLLTSEAGDSEEAKVQKDCVTCYNLLSPSPWRRQGAELRKRLVQASLYLPGSLEVSVVMWLSTSQWPVSRSGMQQVLPGAYNIPTSDFPCSFSFPWLGEEKPRNFGSSVLKMGEPQDSRCLGPWITTWRRATHRLETFIFYFTRQNINCSILESSRHVSLSPRVVLTTMKSSGPWAWCEVFVGGFYIEM